MCDVNIVSGEVYHFSRDVYLPGPLPFVLDRSYSSSALRDGPLGWGWQSSLDVTVDCTPQGTHLIWDDGTPIDLPPLPLWQEIHDHPSGLLLRRAESELTITAADLTKMHFDALDESGHYILT